jgi:hypothetical protein
VNGFPDALIMPESMKHGRRLVQRVGSICDLAEPLLGLDRSAGQRAYIRQQPPGRLFVTPNLRDTILFPHGHARAGQPRYRWEKGEDGIERGYLIDGA